MSLTDWLAVVAVLISGIAIGWNILRDLTDRGNLKVGCRIGHIVVPGAPLDPNYYLIFHITNAGRRPILVTSIGAQRTRRVTRVSEDRNATYWIQPQSLPKMLQPGEYVIEHTAQLVFLEDDLRYLCAWDSLDRTYKAPRRQLRAVQHFQRARGKKAADQD